MHVDLLRVDLNKPIQSPVAAAPGRRRGRTRRQGGRRPRAGHARGHRRGAAQRHPRGLDLDVSAHGDPRHRHARRSHGARTASRSSTTSRPSSPTVTPPRLEIEPDEDSRPRPAGRRGQARPRARAPRRRRRAASRRGRRLRRRVASEGSMRLFGGVTPADWLIVGLGNPGSRYEGTPHNVGFEVARALVAPLGPGQAAARSSTRCSTEGRTTPGGPRVAVLLPQTYMNESGDSAGPARGALKVEPRPRARRPRRDRPAVRRDPHPLGGGLAGHNGLKSLKAGLGSPDFQRVRVGVGRPDTTDPEIVAATCWASGSRRAPRSATWSTGRPTPPSASCGATSPSPTATAARPRRRGAWPAGRGRGARSASPRRRGRAPSTQSLAARGPRPLSWRAMTPSCGRVFV